MKRQFLFGRPVLPAKPTADSPRPLFVLGAYPSALHVRWFGPDGACLIQAVAVDNEPEPFWTGSDEQKHIDTWLSRVSFRDDWGRVEACRSLNGPSGKWVKSKLLDAMAVNRDDAWITDCLNNYFESDAAAKRLDSDRIASLMRSLSIPPRLHAPHSSESDIVRMAKAEHRNRLLEELDCASPETVVTLGNAALRVFGDLVDSCDRTISKLSIDGYGAPVSAIVFGKQVEWFPLAHPAAPAAYQTAHDAWVAARWSSA
jgi:hypothetical protein